MNRVLTGIAVVVSIAICFYTIEEVNYNWLQPQSALAVFVGLGLFLCFLQFPIHQRLKDNPFCRAVDLLLGIAAAVCCGYVVVQTEPAFKAYWALGESLALQERNSQAHSLLAQCLLELGETETAKSHLGRAELLAEQEQGSLSIR